MRCKLRQICDLINDKISINELVNANLSSTYISTENMLPNKCGVVAPSSVPHDCKVTAYRKDDVLISNIRPYFKKIWFAANNGGCSNDVLVFRAKKRVSPNYLHYVLADDSFFDYAMKTSKGTKMPRGDKKAIMEYEVVKMDIETQRKSTIILRLIDEEIATNTAINENLEQQAQAIYQAYFSSKNTNDETICTLDEFCNVFTGKKNSNANVIDGMYKFFTCSPEPLKIDSYIYNGNAIIISGNGAYTGRTRFYNGKFDLYQRTYACTIKENVNPDYIFTLYWFVKLQLSKKIMGGTRGSAIPYIVMNDLAKFEIKFNTEKFERLIPIFKAITETILANQIENEVLANTRDTLLPKLMNGELDVSKVQI